jgi:ABC-type glycerol-3-phosphate transport system substrate-binding protein
MTKKLIAMAAVALLAACGGDDAAEGEGDVVAQDTSVSTVQGTDTVSQPVEVPTTDTVTTTTTVTADTTQGAAQTTGTTTDTTTHSPE